MGAAVRLNTEGMHCIGGYMAKPVGQPQGGIVVVQEIFGVTAHIRAVADAWASQGYTAIAPAFFDFVENDVELEYDQIGTERGKTLATETGLDRAVEAVASAAESMASVGKVGVVGYCWGGTVALLAAQRLALPAVSYYGARNLAFLGQPLRAPVLFHFGGKDRSITADAIQKHRDAYGDAAVHVYANAGHAFSRDVDPGHFDAESARLAWQRSVAFFAQQLAPGT